MKIFSSQKPKSKLPYFIGGGILILIIAFTSSIFWFKHQDKLEQEQLVYSQQLENVKSLIDDAENNYIYKNTAKSMEKIKQAQEELAFLPQSSETQQINHENLKKAITELYNKVLNIEKLVPQQFASLPATKTLNKIELFNGKLITANNNELFVGNSNDFNAEKINFEGSVSFITHDDDKVLIIDENNSIYELTDSNLTSTGQKLTATPTALKLYNNRLYTLQKNSQTILKYTSNFSGNSSWLTNLGDANISTTASISIDGSIYALSENGKITKLFAGAIDEFNNPLLEPEITSADKIMTSLDTNNLFVFEAETKRLMVISKTGALQRQIVFDSLEKIDDLVISDDGKNGYLISNNNLYKFSL